MDKKIYDGLKVMFTPIDGANIVSASKPCEIISVQYYVGEFGPLQCDTEGDPTAFDGDYSYNWNAEPHFP